MSGLELTGDAIGAGVSVIVVDVAPGEGPRLHRHRYREVFVVLEGEATFTLGDEQRVARAGEVMVAHGGVPHRFVNTGDGGLRQVDIHEHPRFETEWRGAVFMSSERGRSRPEPTSAPPLANDPNAA